MQRTKHTTGKPRMKQWAAAKRRSTSGSRSKTGRAFRSRRLCSQGADDIPGFSKPTDELGLQRRSTSHGTGRLEGASDSLAGSERCLASTLQWLSQRKPPTACQSLGCGEVRGKKWEARRTARSQRRPLAQWGRPPKSAAAAAMARAGRRSLPWRRFIPPSRGLSRRRERPLFFR